MSFEVIWSWFVNKILDKILDQFKNKETKKNETEKVLDILREEQQKYEKKMENLNKKKNKAETELTKKEKEFLRLINALKRKGISKENLVEKYKQPLNALLISISDQRIEKKKNSWIKPKEEEKKIRNRLVNEFGAKRIGGAFWIIPPSKVPENLRNKRDLKNFFEKKILAKCKGHFCKLNLFAIIDLKNVFWKNYLPYEQKKPRYKTPDELFDIEDIFNKKTLQKALYSSDISAAEPILQGDIGFFASKSLFGEELERMHKKQKVIEKELGNPTLRILADDSQKGKLTNILSKNGFQKSAELAEQIIEEAKFWKSKLIENETKK